MLFSGYICNKRFEKCGCEALFYIKKLLIRALTKSPGVSTSGLSFLNRTHWFVMEFVDFFILLVTTLTDATDQHFNLL